MPADNNAENKIKDRAVKEEEDNKDNKAKDNDIKEDN